MRTTVTFDDDVAAQLQQLRDGDNRPFKQLVNDLLRAGLAQVGHEEPRPHGPYTRAVSLGRLRLPQLDDVSEALAIAEGDAYR